MVVAARIGLVIAQILTNGIAAPRFRPEAGTGALTAPWLMVDLPRWELEGRGWMQAVPRDWRDLNFRIDGTNWSIGAERSLDVAQWSSRLTLNDAQGSALTPIRRPGWQADNTFHAPLAGSLFLVGQFGAKGDTCEQQIRLVGRTGIGWKLPAWLGGEVQIRRSKLIMEYDAERPRAAWETEPSLVELSARWLLPGELQLEYSSETVAGRSAVSQEPLRQDVRLIVPLHQTGRLHVGAKYGWHEAADSALWHDRLRLYMGVQWRR